MRAVVLTGHGALDRLSFHEDWPVACPGPGQALIAVGACGLDNTDVNTRTAWYSAGVSGATTGEAIEDAGDTDAAWGGKAITFPRVQGADVCGHIVAVGIGCNASLLGRRMLIDPWLRDWDDPLDRDKCGYFGSECDGGFADYAIADVRNIHTIDSDLSDAELATFPTSCVTAENMLNRAGVQADDRVLRFRAHPAASAPPSSSWPGAAGPRPSRFAAKRRPRRSRHWAPIMSCRVEPKDAMEPYFRGVPLTDLQACPTRRLSRERPAIGGGSEIVRTPNTKGI